MKTLVWVEHDNALVKVHLADDPAYEHALAENVAPLVAALMGKP